jgi:flagellar biogenesis protein FliO
MASVDPFIVLIVGALLTLILFLYFMLRRTLQGFQEGMKDGRQ